LTAASRSISMSSSFEKSLISLIPVMASSGRG
jgi:hypothetical protein